MTRDANGPALNAYLARLQAELAALPAEDRREILLETRSHVLERTGRSPGRGVDDVLAELGTPQAYARQFLPEEQIPAAPPVRGPGALGGLARLATGRWTALPLLMAVVFAYSIAALVFFIGMVKLFDPRATGIYTSDAHGRTGFMIVLSNPHHGGHEVLGMWLIPIALLIALAIHLLMSALLKRVLRAGTRT